MWGSGEGVLEDLAKEEEDTRCLCVDLIHPFVVHLEGGGLRPAPFHVEGVAPTELDDLPQTLGLERSAEPAPKPFLQPWLAPARIELRIEKAEHLARQMQRSGQQVGEEAEPALFRRRCVLDHAHARTVDLA